MQTMPTGARLDIGDGTTTCVVEAASGGPRLAVAMVTHRDGRDPEIAIVEGDSPWTLRMPPRGTRSTVVVYMTKDTEAGKVEDRGPLSMRMGSEGFTLDSRTDRHGAVILAEIYEHSGKQRARVRGDGYAFGIKALARKEGLPVEPFLPARDRYDEGSSQPPPDFERGPRPGRGAIGSGSGIIVAVNHVITNAHVVHDTTAQTVHGPDGNVQGRVLAIDPIHDLALVLTPGIGGTPIPVRSAGSLFLGESVIAAGFPLRDVLGDDLKMTHGNVSGMRGQGGNVSAFQFSAPIGSGSSGGAVMDQYGNLLGVVTSALAHEAMRERGGISENVNFGTKASLVLEMLAAHEVDWISDAHRNGTQSEVAKRIRRSVISITVS